MEGTALWNRQHLERQAQCLLWDCGLSSCIQMPAHSGMRDALGRDRAGVSVCVSLRMPPCAHTSPSVPVSKCLPITVSASSWLRAHMHVCICLPASVCVSVEACCVHVDVGESMVCGECACPSWGCWGSVSHCGLVGHAEGYTCVVRALHVCMFGHRGWVC